MEKNESKRKRVSELSSIIYQDVCKESKILHVVNPYDFIDDRQLQMAAEPACFEYYKWGRFDQRIIDIFWGNKTILVGCFRNKKHFEWIISNSIYNIRLGNRKGSVDEDKECISNASLLVLYNSINPGEISVFKILSHNVMSGEQLKKLNYPKKRIGKRYMTFEIEEDSSLVENLKKNHLIENMITNYPEHVSGTPVFLEP